MNAEKITAFLQENHNAVTLIIGIVLLIGAIMNWNWLCDPTGKPDPIVMVAAQGESFSSCWGLY